MKEGVLDQCGVTVLAGKAVGAPFVGTAAAALVLSEVLRVFHGGPAYQLVDLDLKCIEHRNAVRHPTDFSRLNRRMHNKSFTADTQATIVGGRNIGDEYFGAGENMLFADLDVVAVGRIAGETAAAFDL